MLKLALFAGAGLVLLYVVSKLTGAGTAALNSAGTALQAVNPLNNDNVIYQGVNSGVQAATGDGSATFGTWLYDLINPAPTELSGGASGSW